MLEKKQQRKLRPIVIMHFHSKCTKTFVENRHFAVKSYSHIFLDMALCNV